MLTCSINGPEQRRRIPPRQSRSVGSLPAAAHFPIAGGPGGRSKVAQASQPALLSTGGQPIDRGLRGFHGFQCPELKPPNTPTTRKPDRNPLFGPRCFQVFCVVRGSIVAHECTPMITNRCMRPFVQIRGRNPLIAFGCGGAARPLVATMHGWKRTTSAVPVASARGMA
jgi:hypothetical protein